MTNKVKQHIKKREGVVYQVYLDTLGNPTAGIGHLLTKAELKKYPVGSNVSKDQVNAWFERDFKKAEKAALKQAKEMGIDSEDFINALISVNFQLGEGWTKKFYSTYPALVRGDYAQAVHNLQKSLWMKQTPVRVNDFIAAILQLPEKNRTPKNLKKSRTMWGGASALVSIPAIAEIDSVKAQIEPLIYYSEYLKYVFIALAVGGVILGLWARYDDHKKGLR